MSDWKQVGENLVRHKAGTIYLRAKVAGKVQRRSLGTDDLRIAKIKRDEILAALRKQAEASTETARTLGDMITLVGNRMASQAHLRPASRKYYKEVMTTLLETMPTRRLAKLWGADQAAAWWSDLVEAMSPQRANNALAMAKRVGQELVDQGIRLDNPAAGLKRVPLPKTELNVPSLKVMDAIIKDIRKQGKAWSAQSADFVAFLAFSGCRLSQAQALTWSDISQKWVSFQGGIQGAKGADWRRLPINPRLREVIERLRQGRSDAGPIFTMAKPREALWNACDRLKLKRMRIHDLRHFFATWAIESGVDVLTVSRWLGHKDGGALVMRTYGHLRDDHSLSLAVRLA